MHIQTHPTFAYTHPTSHTNTLNHYYFVLKQKKKKTKDKTYPHYKISTHSNKKIKKNIKLNKKNSHDKKPNNTYLQYFFLLFIKA